MLGRLFNAASSLTPTSYTTRNPPLESLTEDEHTRGLLFPDPSVLQTPQSGLYSIQNGFSSASSTASAFDDHGGLELDALKDFRIIIAQDAFASSEDPCVLLDSAAEPVPAGLALNQRTLDGASKHRRGVSGLPSLQSTSTAPAGGSMISPRAYHRPSQSTSSGAFCPERLRSSTFSINTNDSRPTSDSREETKVLMNCMFGSSAFSYKGPSTKFHVLSPENEPSITSPATSPIESFSLSKREPLARASTYGALPIPQLRQSPPAHARGQSRGTVLLTRMFNVNLPETTDAIGGEHSQPATSVASSPAVGAFPFPEARGDHIDGFQKRKKLKEKKTPMYAVAIVIQLPNHRRGTSRPSSRYGSRSSNFSKPTDSVPSSLGSEVPPWSFLDGGGGMISPTLPAGGLLDDRVDELVGHWASITRTLSSLEREAGKEILRLLKEADNSPKTPVPKPAKEKNTQRTNQSALQLHPYALAAHRGLQDAAKKAIHRVGITLRIPRVLTGQGRWGIWEEEARWCGRWAGGKSENFFLYNLLTAFLGNHTEWLSSLGPGWYKRRHFLQQKAHQDSEPVMSHRTVIVSADKMAARRLIFLLSAFLPGKHKIDLTGSPLRPATAASCRPASQSPPGGQVARQESLRRTVNRRARQHRLAVEESGKQDLSTSLSSLDAEADGSSFGETTHQHGQRRDSDTKSIRTAGLPIPSNDLSTRKSSAATTSSVTPIRTTAVPHFASGHNRLIDEQPSMARSGSSDSLASANLMQTLKRSESNADMESQATASRWGSLLSTFWSGRQESSDSSDLTFPSQPGSVRVKRASSSRDMPGAQQLHNRLSDMAREVGTKPEDTNLPFPSSSLPQQSLPELIESPERQGFASQSRRESSPIRLIVDETEGIVDVDIGLPGFLSGDVAFTSPLKSRHTPSVSSLDGFASIHSHGSNTIFSQKDTETGINVAGWLKAFHEDFTLQAVRPYPNLEARIKAAMSAEPTPAQATASTPTVEDGLAERWVDVCTTLIAEAQNFSIKRLRLRRKIRVGFPGPTASAGNSRPSSPHPDCVSQLGNLFAAAKMKQNMAAANADCEEDFVEEQVMDLDPTLVDAVERVLARSGQTSRVQSRATSPSRQASGPHHSKRPSTVVDGSSPVDLGRGECKKMVVGALEQVVRSVTAERTSERGRAINGDAQKPKANGVMEKDSTLREGVRQWLQDVEEAC